MNPCFLCPRSCGADRTKEKSFCSCGEDILLAHTMIHRWEEPCVSGKNGTAAFFFGGCSLGCVYCQNGKITSGKIGKTVTPDELTGSFFEMASKGAETIDLVTPTHFWDKIAEAVRSAKSLHFDLPIIANTSGYEKADILERYANETDVFLTDFKYLSPDISLRYSGIDDYADFALPALKKMVELVGKPRFSSSGILQKGVIVRHLVLPGNGEESKKILSLLYEKFGNDILYSLMSQYTPPRGIDKKFPELARPLRRIEYKSVVRYAEKLGITNGFIQEEGAAGEKYIPDFPFDPQQKG